MQSEEIRSKFLEFFKRKGHVIVPSSSLIPTDPSVLLTSAGMQQFKKYYTGDADPMKDFGGLNTVSIQKCFRTSDIDEVGDETHNTFFEMLGNFSFGGYYKKEAIKWGYELLTEGFGIKKSRISATYFGGDKDSYLPEDSESLEELRAYFAPEEIRAQSKEENFWGPTGSEGPCGPTAEFYVDGVEIWNLVFNEYYCDALGSFKKLQTPGVDTGMGMERVAMVLQKKRNVFETDLFTPIINSLPTSWTDIRIKRIIADHSRAVVFLISDGIRPSNKGAGYILRRLIRRSIVYIHKKQITSFSNGDTLPVDIEIDLKTAFDAVIKNYSKIYPELDQEITFSVFDDEKKKFGLAFRQGLREINKLNVIDAPTAFKIYESYGLPFELIKEFSGEKSKLLTHKDFDKEFEEHQKISRAGAEKKFGGHGLILDTGEIKAKDEKELEKVTRLHTATHLMQAALRKVLGDEVHQMGSDITAERTRFDFSFGRKITDEELKEVQDLVNSVIEKDLPVQFVEMPLEEAKRTGALYSTSEKYPEKVKVYYAGNSLSEAFSKELCGGPHVERSGVIGKFRILKEEGAASGVRRVRAEVI